ncbi:DUF6149 family protein [Halocalculus aciditolerans]|nr:DUF6149 family protein [Halocalculus aciditolerans]
MKIHQNVKHFAFKKSLELPVVGEKTHERLVGMHVDIFLGKADADRRDEREAHLEAFFDGTIDMYLAALQAGHPEAAAREMTHVVANFDFYNHGWTEMMEFPADELSEHYDRYADFFAAHDITLDDPLGEFVPAGGVPDAPATPDKLDDGDYANADAGYADDVYVEDADGDLHKGGTSNADDDADVTA